MMDHCCRYQINLDLEPTQSLYVVKDSGACLLVVHVCRTVDLSAVLLSCLLLAMLFSVLLIFPCSWACSSRGPRARVAFFLPLTTGSLAVVSSSVTFVVVCDSVVRFLSPPTSPLSIKPLRDCCFAVDALVPLHK